MFGLHTDRFDRPGYCRQFLMGRSRNNNARKEGVVDWSEETVQALHLTEENHGKLSRDRQLRGQELKSYTHVHANGMIIT